jgi:hypothetical protein
MLLNVLKFVEWPGALPGGPALQACALGAPRFAAALASAAQGGAVPLVVREVRTPAGLAGCQFAIVGPDFREGLESLAERLTSQGVLTVSDTEGFGAAGVLVNFVLQGDRVRFEVNLEAARRAGLRFSSKLLRLAIVLGGAP